MYACHSIEYLRVEQDYHVFAARIKDKWLSWEQVKEFAFLFDFPKGGDMEEDFVAVFTVEKDETSLIAIPYNPDNGEVYEQITESSHLAMVLEQFQSLSGGIQEKEEG